MLRAALLATKIAAGIIVFYLAYLWYPKANDTGWRDGLRLKELRNVVYVALAAWFLAFVISAIVFSEMR